MSTVLEHRNQRVAFLVIILHFQTVGRYSSLHKHESFRRWHILVAVDRQNHEHVDLNTIFSQELKRLILKFL
jgi:hypothetical protein